MSRTSALTRKPKGLGRRNFAQGYPRSHATPTPTSKSKGQKLRWAGGILWRRPSRTACSSHGRLLLTYMAVTIGIHSYTTAPSVTNGTWKLAKANWTTFSLKASSDLGRNYPSDLEDPIEHFTDILTNIANNTIPKNKPRSKKRDAVWLNDECINSICSRRKATRKVKICPTSANIENLRIIRAKTKRTI